MSQQSEHAVARKTIRDYFRKLDSYKSICTICNKEIKTSGNTTNIKAHLKTNHPEISKKVTSIQVPDSRRCPEKEIPFVQKTLKDCLDNVRKYKDGGETNKKITNALVFMICKDNMPVCCVEKVGLHELLRVCCPRYKIPSRFTITQLIDEKYEVEVAKMKKYLEKVEYIAFTTDCVTITNSTRSFLTITAHFISNGILDSICMAALRLSESHTGLYMSEVAKKVVEEEYGISVSQQALAMTTDNASNAIALAKEFVGEENWIPCIAHTINLVVDDALTKIKVFDNLIGKVKRIVSFFKHSVNAMDSLRKAQENNGVPEGRIRTPTQNIDTRWNSCLDMLSSFLQLSSYISQILSRMGLEIDVPDMLPNSELKIAKELVELLGPFKEASEEMGGERYVTASLVIPWTYVLDKHIQCANLETETGRYAQENLKRGITNRLIPLEKKKLLAKATIVDPRFKKTTFFSASISAQAVNDIASDVRFEHRRMNQQLPQDNEVSSTNMVVSSTWEKHFKNLSKKENNAMEAPSTSGLPNELKLYFDHPIIEKQQNPLEYWKKNQAIMPALSKIAMKYLIPPASSVPSERLASVIKLVVADNRSRLSHDHVKKRVFLKSLHEKFWSE